MGYVPSPKIVATQGFAVAKDGVIDVRTISDTGRAAIVNWLVVNGGIMIFPHDAYENIEALWRAIRGSAEVIIVKIEPK